MVKPIPNLFTVYYINHQKMFEMRMPLDKKLKTSSSEENQGGFAADASLSTEAEFIPPFLAKFKAIPKGSVSHERQVAVVDIPEYANTNSYCGLKQLSRRKAYQKILSLPKYQIVVLTRVGDS